MCRVVLYNDVYRDAMIAVVQHVYDEYGFTWETDGYHRDLYDVDAHYASRGGAFWVALVGEDVVGCAGVTTDGTSCELHRMYLLSEFRGRGLGQRLLDVVVAFSVEHGCRQMWAWSDVKLPHGHRLYLKNGFARRGDRICDDPDQSHEYGFVKELS